MTDGPESGFFSPPPRHDAPWWWQLLDEAGAVVEPAGERSEFANRGDAESWVGEYYPDLVADGVSAVTLFEGDREVYGPMSLEP